MDALQVVGDPRRREILRLVWDRELAAGDIADRFPVTFGAVSQHLGVLRDAGFVRVRAEGNRRFYRADPVALGPLAPALEAMWTDALSRLALAVEADPEPAPREPREGQREAERAATRRRPAAGPRPATRRAPARRTEPGA